MIPGVRLGSTGLQVSRLRLGTMTFGAQANEAEAFAILDACAEGGVSFIDTAEITRELRMGDAGR